MLVSKGFGNYKTQLFDFVNTKYTLVIEESRLPMGGNWKLINEYNGIMFFKIKIIDCLILRVAK